MKKIFILFLLILLTGCTTSYNLEISNNSFKEKITIYIDKSEIPKETVEDIELDDPITPFLNSKTEAHSNAYYKKKVLETDNQYKVDMNYNYTTKEFSDSNSLKLCFENYEFRYKDNYYIHAYGNFLCGISNEVSINIKTNNKVIKHNADSVNGNVYTWHINSDNESNVNIEFEVKKGFPYKVLIYSIIGVLVISITLYLIINKRRRENKI